MTQEVRVTLTLEVDASQTKDDIFSFLKKAIEHRCVQHTIENKPSYSLTEIENIEEESEIYDTENIKEESEISVPSINIGMLDPKEILGKTIIDFSLDKDDDGEELIINLHDGKQIEVYFGSGDIMVASD